MVEMMSERIRRNARELKLLGLSENLDDLVGRAEEGDLGYRRFLEASTRTSRAPGPAPP